MGYNGFSVNGVICYGVGCRGMVGKHETAFVSWDDGKLLQFREEDLSSD